MPSNPEAGSPLISVLLVNFNGLRHLEECLESLRAQSFRDFETVLVDNASSDGSLEFVRTRFPEVRAVPSGANLGFAGGNNLGLRHCRGRFVYFLNNDVRADRGALAALADAAAEHPGTGVFASLMLDYRDPSRVDNGGDTVYTCGKTFSFAGWPAALFTSPRPVTSACGGAAMYSRELLDRLGGFDADFFLNFEDLDLSFRARHAGQTVLFVPASRIHHKGSASLGGKKSALSFYYGQRNFLPFIAKNFPAPDLVRFLPSILFVKAWDLLSSLWFRQPGAYLRGNLAGIALLPRMLAKRKAILGSSTLKPGEFRRLLRRGWVRDRLAALRGRYDRPL